MNDRKFPAGSGLRRKSTRLIFGLFLYALGSLLSIQANIGLAPWEAFSMGVSYLTRLSYGQVVVATGLAIIVVVFALKEKIGLGTLLNALLIGVFVDLIASSGLVPAMSGLWSGVAMLLAGQVAICVGSYFYIGAALGCGPRDSLMIAIARRLPRVPIGAIRALLEGSVLIAGWLLGARVGVGTMVSVLGIGFILQATFRLLRFDVRRVDHQSLAATWSGRQAEARRF